MVEFWEKLILVYANRDQSEDQEKLASQLLPRFDHQISVRDYRNQR
jgi:hypothetical protein